MVERAPGGTPGAPAPAVVMSAVRYRWPRAAVDCLAIDELVLATGERVFLRGPSGSGKTTLLSLVGGVIQPQAGTVMVAGQALGLESVLLALAGIVLGMGLLYGATALSAAWRRAWFQRGAPTDIRWPMD